MECRVRLETGRVFVAVVFAAAATLSTGCRGVRPVSNVTGGLLDQPGLLKSEFIYQTASFPSAHASTIVQTRKELVAAWFGGSDEGNADVGIWLARHDGLRWSPPVEVADGVQPDGTRYPCWNPVLHRPERGPLLLFYKVGPDPRRWWGMLKTSDDEGRTWSVGRRLPQGILGPVRCKAIGLSDGSLLCGSSTEHQGWRLHLERTPDLGLTWEETLPLNEGRAEGLIQPTLLRWPQRGTQLLCRSQQGRVYESWMGSDWRTWSPPVPTDLPNPNAGIDAVMLGDGRALLVYNHTARGRSPLNVAVSPDGKTWQAALVLENQPGEYSYPAVIQTRDGLVHVTYTWKRQRIAHVVIDPKKLQPRDWVDGLWP